MNVLCVIFVLSSLPHTQRGTCGHNFKTIAPDGGPDRLAGVPPGHPSGVFFTMIDYNEFVKSKRHTLGEFGFEPDYFPDIAFDFQKAIIEKAVKKGRIAIFADTGLGKTLMLLSIAHNVVRKTNGRVLILTPLAVAFQFIKEAEKLGIPDVEYSKDGKYTGRIIICNYERLHYFNPSDFQGVLLDESSILKNFEGKIKSQVTAFIKKIPYRFLSTATPSPNDFVELGTSSEALGYMGYMEMLTKFFGNNENNIRPQEIATKWYLKPHAETSFFEWVAGWSIVVRKPSDIGFKDDRYVLPDLRVNDVIVRNTKNWVIDNQIMLFNGIAHTMTEVKQEQKNTTKERCEKAVELASNARTSVYWCNFNEEGDLLASLDNAAVQVKGGMSIEQKEEILIAFSDGEIQRLITKPKITAFGLNWQHCNHTVYFPTWSYEQYYQAIRRFWRFGQKNTVTVDRIFSDGQKRVLDAINLKTDNASRLFDILIRTVNKQEFLQSDNFSQPVSLPKFI